MPASVHYNPQIGAYSPCIPWVPTSTEILRRAAILDLISSLKPGSVLEIGCGAGALIYELARKNYWGKGVDTSKNALNIARSMTKAFGNKFQFDSELNEGDKKTFDYVFSIAVLEHIEDESEALMRWREFLKPGGTLVLAVPGHQKLWGHNDEVAGHYRRYERYGLLKLLAGAGFSVRCIHSYGYPFLNFEKFLKNKLRMIRAKRRKNGRSLPKPEATARSGIHRPIWQKLIRIYSGNFFGLIWKVLFSIQRKFYAGDKGTGYLVIADYHV